MWIPPETIDPILLHAPTRKSVAVFGAVRPSDGELVTQPAERFNAATFHDFLIRLRKHRRKGRKMVVVLDNARWHHAQWLKDQLRPDRRWLILDYLPPYSPDLNPIERVWKMTRRICTHNRYFPALEDLMRTVTEQFDRWTLPNTTLLRLCAII